MKLTIRGAFPYFKYEQTHARIYGFDFSSEITIRNSIQGIIRYSFLRGKDTSNNEHIISWLPNGTAFKIYEEDEFSAKIMGKYFQQSKFKSFIRQVRNDLPYVYSVAYDLVSTSSHFFLNGLLASSSAVRLRFLENRGWSSARKFLPSQVCPGR